PHCVFGSLRFDLLERLALVAGRPEDADQATGDKKTSQNPGEGREAGRGEDGHEEAPQTQTNTDNGEGHTLRGAAYQRWELLRTPQLKEALRAEAAAELHQEDVDHRERQGEREERKKRHADDLHHGRSAKQQPLI